ncbi:MAG: hypothetical protein ACRD4B_02705 [Acidobacteriota bacterium]
MEDEMMLPQQIDLLWELRQRFSFLTFMTDQEVEHFLSILASVAEGTSVKPDEILQQIEQESCKNLASC